MKTKLLKRLKRRYELQERNGRYRVFDNQKCSGDVYNQTDWIGINPAKQIRRKWILEEANKYLKPKRKL